MSRNARDDEYESDGTRPWYRVLSDFSRQLQAFTSAMWTISFALVTNLTKLDGLKDVLEEFNKITLNPIFPLLCTVKSDIFVDDSEKITAYLPKDHILQMCGNLVAPVVGEDLDMYLIFKGKEYCLTRVHSEMQDFYVFTSEYKNTSSRSDRVLINDRESKLAVRQMNIMEAKDIYDLIQNVKFTMMCSSVDSGEYITTKFRKQSAYMFESLKMHFSFIRSNEKSNNGMILVMFGDQTLVKVKYPADDDYVTLFHYLNQKHLPNTNNDIADPDHDPDHVTDHATDDESGHAADHDTDHDTDHDPDYVTDHATDDESGHAADHDTDRDTDYDATPETLTAPDP
jgi:hypothetical protein